MPQLETIKEHKGIEVLLIAQVLYLFVFMPLAGVGVLGRVSDDFAQAILAVIALRVIRASALQRYCLAAVYALRHITYAINPNYPWVGMTSMLLFYLTISGFILYAVLRSKEVSQRTVVGAVSFYLFIAICFTTAYGLVNAVEPNAFSNLSAVAGAQVSQMTYFSLITISTVGYGDITPLHPVTRSLASLEAVLGQIYLATMLARLVGLQASKAMNKG